MSLFKTLLVWLGAASNNNDFSTCDVFLAPSKLNGGGWGVYAARDFEESEVVEHAPLYLRFEEMAPVLKFSVLDDYHYGIHRDGITYGAPALGMTMFYNHDESPNVRWTTIALGRGEPSWEDPVGFVTTRAISQGEELFSSYGIGDDGVRWFATRRLTMTKPTKDSKIPLNELDDYKSQYCSKSYVGPGKSTYDNRFRPSDEFYLFQSHKLPSVDAPTAVAKVHISKGEVIEMAPALVLSKEAVAGSALAPLVFTWNDLTSEHHDALRDLRNAGQLKLQYQSPETDWRRIDRFESLEKVVIFPAGGNTGLIDRIGTDESANCRMHIRSSGSGAGSAGIVLEIYALTDITAGDILRLNLPPTGTEAEKRALLEILETTGQLIPDSLRSLRVQSNNNVEL